MAGFHIIDNIKVKFVSLQILFHLMGVFSFVTMTFYLRFILFLTCFFIQYVNAQDVVIISGQPGPMINKKHFLENGLDRSLKMRNAIIRENKNDSVCWIIYNSGKPNKGGYPDSILQNYIVQANNECIKTVIVNSNKEFVDFVNCRADSLNGKAKISQLYYYGHATLGNLEIGFVNGYFWNKLFSQKLKVNQLVVEAFEDSAMIDLVGGCRTALPPNYIKKMSVAEQFQRLTSGKILASDVRVYYPGGPVSDKTLVRKNNGNIIEFQGTRE